MKKHKLYTRIICLVFLVMISGCKKFLNGDLPATTITVGSVYSTNAGAAAAMTSVYEQIIESGTFASGANSIGFLTGLTGDELTLYYSDPFQQACYSNTLNSTTYPSFWENIYRQLHVVNVVLSNVQNSKDVSDNEKNQLIGEAKFMHALLLHYATLLYGEVPVVTTGDFQVTSLLQRASVDDVYKQIILDLVDAQKLLPNAYVDPLGNPSTERVRPNKATSTALLARIYLYQNKWTEADGEATKLINDPQFLLDPDLNSVFLTTSKEAIWQLQTPAPANVDTFDGNYYILTSAPGAFGTPVALSPFQVNSFESGDLRFKKWVNSFTDATGTYYYPYKYKVGLFNIGDPVPEYTTVFRLAEQYLIRAEARVHEGKLTGGASAQEDINAIRFRAGLSGTTATTESELLNSILKERRVELFTEWGHRWFDLKRSGKLDAVMNTVAPVKHASWAAYKYLMPISQTEITADQNLTQTPGYN